MAMKDSDGLEVEPVGVAGNPVRAGAGVSVMIAGRCLASAAVALLASPAAADQASELRSALEQRIGVEIERVALVRFASTGDGFRPAGIEVEQGRGVTTFAFGEASGFERPTRPRDLLWLRIGGGEVENTPSETYSFVAHRSGAIEIGVRPDGVRWADCTGALPSSASQAPTHPLDLQVVVATWKVDLESGLSNLRSEPAVAAALADLESAPKLPKGFRSLCHLRNSRVFAAFEDGERRGIRGTAERAAGIVKKAVDLELEDDTEITFEWRYDTLPALGPETDARSHDYSSIAVELDNGQDITWMRARDVPAGTDFRCPLPWWDQRETHIVIESGERGLGEWARHTRRIAADYDRAVGGTRPRRIVGVWFISVGAFGGQKADATFANVTLRSGSRTIELFENRQRPAK